MHHKPALAHTIRKTIVTAVATATLASLALGHSAHAASPKGPYNCELGSTALPDDRWAQCATPSSIDYCDLGEHLVPDDRWAHCGAY